MTDAPALDLDAVEARLGIFVSSYLERHASLFQGGEPDDADALIEMAELFAVLGDAGALLAEVRRLRAAE